MLYKEKLKSRGCKPTTIQNYITACKIFFKWTEQEGYYPNIAEHIKGAKLNKEHKKDYLTSSQVKDILESIEKDNIKGLRDYVIILLVEFFHINHFLKVPGDVINHRESFMMF